MKHLKQWIVGGGIASCAVGASKSSVGKAMPALYGITNSTASLDWETSVSWPSGEGVASISSRGMTERSRQFPGVFKQSVTDISWPDTSQMTWVGKSTYAACCKRLAYQPTVSIHNSFGSELLGRIP
jgi:hypothetical protein